VTLPGGRAGHNGPVAGPVFRRDLYRGTARDYDRFRVPYPPGLITGLADRAGADGTGMLLDLACGTGLLSFALHGRFAGVWAVDQEPGMVAVVREKAAAAGLGNIRALACAAEDLDVPAASFDLVAIGNAFHRLPRDTVAASAFRWLRPGRFLALVWSDSPWAGDQPWQRAMAATMDTWRSRVRDRDRIPPGYDQARRERPDAAVLRDAGFENAGSWQFPAAHHWTAGELAGFALSTSVLSRAALGGKAAGFARDLRGALHASTPDGRFRQVLSFGYDLARRPGPVTPNSHANHPVP
jgi:SAM-dependent methyltransferase